MARVKLNIPQKKIANVRIHVRVTDLNYGNHVGNDSIVSLIHDARAQWLNANSISELDVGGAGLVMIDLEVEYKAEIFFPDELSIDLFAGEPNGSAFEVFYEMKNKTGKTVVKAKTGMACFNFSTRKLAPMPDGFLKILQKN